MTDHQIRLIKKSWSFFRKMDPQLIGEVFFRKLFLDHPQTRHLFPGDQDVRSGKLVVAISRLVGNLHEHGESSDYVLGLSLLHAPFTLKADIYESINTALLWTLKKGLGQDWNEETEAAWSACLNTMHKTRKWNEPTSS